MSKDYRGITEFPEIKRFQLSSTDADFVTEVKLPSSCARIQIGGSTNITKLATTGIDNTAIGSDFVLIPADNLITVRIGRGSSRNNTIYISSATLGTYVNLVMEEI